MNYVVHLMETSIRRLHGLVAEVHELPGRTSGGPNGPAGKMDKMCG